ncbi:MAG TPA: diguanylate cyclase [Cyanobacteria bacterium UBA11368]|nr:diguanylate cyclase [Cyanobacteria bacterium UBA11368]
MSQAHLRVLLVEDCEEDALLLMRELRRTGYKLFLQRVETAAAMQKQLVEREWDMVISDYSLPTFSAPEALKLLQQTGLDLPFIIVSGYIGEDAAVAAMKAGAHDYVMKDNLARLIPAVERELREAAVRRQNQLAEAGRRESEQRFRALIENATDIVVIVDKDGIFRYISPSQERIFGYKTEALLGKKCLDYIYPEDVPLAIATMKRSIKQPRISQAAIECRLFRCNGSLCFLEAVATNLLDDPSVKGVVINCHDITERKQAEEQLRFYAFYDPLTGLPNRTLFLENLGHLLDRTSKQDMQDLSPARFAVLFLDLDRFDVIKYSLGHLVADELLSATAARLVRCVGIADMVARVGIDEFALLIAQLEDVGQVQRIAQKIHTSIAMPFHLEGREVFTTASIGIAIAGNSPIPCMTNYDRPEDFLRAADTAIYYAKRRGKGSSAVFDASMHAHALARLELEADLRRGIERQELLLHYQPIVSLFTGRLTGFEALVRWNHPQMGLVSPGDFIPAAEETGLILPLGSWVLREACRQLACWQKQFPSASCLTMSVNLAGLQLVQPDLIDGIDRILQETGLEGSRLKLELTETIFMEIAEVAPAVLDQLKARQIQLSIDDFGTGYSSLSRLHQWPLDTLKIDRSFVSRLSLGNESSEVVRTIVNLAHNLGLDVIAEGVETAEQMYKLQSLQCQCGQGNFLSKPLDSKAATDLIGEKLKIKN